MYVMAGAHRDQKHWGPLKIVLQATVSYQMWVLATELKPSVSTAGVLDY